MSFYTTDEKTMIKSSSSSSSSHLNNNNPLQSTHQNAIVIIINNLNQNLKMVVMVAVMSNVSRVNIPIVFNKNRGQISMYRFINTKELREMKLREDELKCQRIRSIGISYPNLNSICDDDYSTSDDQTSEDNKDSFHSRCSSNPDLLNGNHLNNHNNNHSSSPSPSSTSSSSSSSYTIAIVDINNTNNSNNNSTITSSTTTLSSDTSDSLLNDCGLKIGGPRRKIPLIAIWEQKINECQTNGDTITTTTTATTNNQNIKDQ
ncbi:hypothetical protein DERP_003739 [Dermatophagoides pteronyssinus]|uniref:Uncharacterized protein n=1 Tax=Dermatophagoides pteronyssinus TaxID=6956 RepID=A0ABQ8JM76_DERPT|nr:hypothetical protein DERP_003739 [Dermatophagoides pteronyssinus]